MYAFKKDKKYIAFQELQPSMVETLKEFYNADEVVQISYEDYLKIIKENSDIQLFE